MADLDDGVLLASESGTTRLVLEVLDLLEAEDVSSTRLSPTESELRWSLLRRFRRSSSLEDVSGTRKFPSDLTEKKFTMN